MVAISAQDAVTAAHALLSTTHNSINFYSIDIKSGY